MPKRSRYNIYIYIYKILQQQNGLARVVFEIFLPLSIEVIKLAVYIIRYIMWNSRIICGSVRGLRFASNKAKPVNQAREAVATRFPTMFNPIRSASNPRIQLPKGLVYNPAPSVPSPYNTPAAFLPKNADRKVMHEKDPYEVENMPLLQQIQQKNYHLTDKDVIEIQKLRQEDPEKWTRKSLAEKFGCSEFFISIASKPLPEHQAEMDRRLKVIKGRWSQKRIVTRRDRQRRRELWLRDE
jgi:hypothetical protein